MREDVNLSETPPTPIASPEHTNMIRSACQSDIEAIVEVERTSFPQVYTDVDDLVQCRRRELEGGYPCYRILAAGSARGDRTAIYGLAIIESYLRSYREYRDAKTGEGITLPANRPPDKKPAYSALMAATRADPGLLDDEFLFVSEICIHPRMRARGHGTRLMRHIVDVANVLAVKIIVLVEGSVSDAAQQWTADEAEEVNAFELAALKEREQRTTMSFYGRLGFKKRAYFFWGRRDCAIPRIFYVMQYPGYR
ncbi:hypothetical protein ANO14919_088740 [Xylariales sp. No.14919]|nr:hypothetical protein F5X98DRAFT_380870 [Xylaria grammica]GAW19388.1 hypothetical protein ANO14919_088740 [Xylariales sp. No.14919]